jgi:excisionase family DNA binding protein
VSNTEAAKAVGVTRQAMQKKIDTGKVPGSYKDGRRWRLPADVVDAMRAERFAAVVERLRGAEAQYLDAVAALDGLRVDEPVIADVLAIDLANKLAIVRTQMASVTRTAADEADMATMREAVDSIEGTP